MSRSLTPAASSPVNSWETLIDEDLGLEELCRNEFGLKLSKLTARIDSQAKEQQTALLCFCADIGGTHDVDRRREIAKNFIMELITITELANDRFMRLLIKMKETFVANAQMTHRALIDDISRFENEVEELKTALNRVELEKDAIKAEADRRFEEEKDILERKLRDELQACQICLHNPRNIIIMPCLHAHFCAECMEAVQKANKGCPTCRGAIRGTLPYIA